MAEFTKGRGYSKGDLRAEGTPIILYGNLYTDYQTEINEVNTYAKLSEDAVLSRGGEVLVPASGETAEDISRASVLKQSDVIIGGDLNVIYPKSSIASTFLALELTYGRSHTALTKKAQGISVVHLHNSDIMGLASLFPCLGEQERIGAFFRSQDEGIAAVGAQIERLRAMKQACLERMFA